MNASQLQEFIGEVLVFLQALDKAIPNKIDEELISFLQAVKDQPWFTELLVGVLGKQVRK